MKPIYQAPLLDRLRDIEKAVQYAIKYEALKGQEITIHEQWRAVENLKPDEIAIWDWVIRPRFPDPPEKKPAKRFEDCTEVERLKILLAESDLQAAALLFALKNADVHTANMINLAAQNYGSALSKAGLSHLWRSEVVSPAGCEEKEP